MKHIEFVTHTPSETKNIAKKIGKHAEAGLFFCLFGPMGSGKTTFTQGFVDGVGFLGEPSIVTSPTYALIHELPTKIPVYHLDLFRLSSMDDVEELGYRDILRDDIIVIVEWAEKLQGEFPDNFISIQFSDEAEEHERTIAIIPNGKKMELFLDRLLEIGIL